MLPQRWIRLLEPDVNLPGAVTLLTPELLQEYQIQGLIFDVDDTLVSSRTREMSPEVCQWVQDLKSLVKVVLVSNNLKRARIRRIAKKLDVPYYFGARKPSRRSLKKALAVMDLQPQQAAMVGDRLFTDVIAGNRLGMVSILVEPVQLPTGEHKTSWLRSVEIWISQWLGASISK
ncbi:MAG: YqeG family HAD IIIA-type phosphatase [Cyanobacteria bacterium P01_F01_bin.42]